MTPETPSDPVPRVLGLGSERISITDVGEGPAVVVVHGMPGSVRDFRWLGAEVEERIRLVRVDLPGFGASSASRRGRTFEALGALLASAVDTLGLDRPVLLGHSMGGPVVAEACSGHPGAFRGAALVASVGPRPHRLMRTLRHREWVGRALSVPGLSRLLLPSMRAGFRAAGFPRSTPDQEILTTMRLVGTLSFARHRANLGAMGLPTLVAWAEDDPVVEKAVSEELYWACPGGPRIAYPDGGHNIQKTRAVELGDALVQWVEQLTGA